MKAALMTDIRKGYIGEKEKPFPKEGEVLVQIKAVGVCGSDLHLFANGRNGSYIVPFPYVLGHEGSGIVVEVGEGVKSLKVGDRVSLEPGKTCGKCEFCKSGKYNLCDDVVFFSAPPYNGIFCEYVAHPEELCYKIPDNMSYIEGALIEPLAVGYHAVRQAEARCGQSAVVIGLGCIGIVTILSLKAAGVDKIFAIDIAEDKLEFVKRFDVIPINGKDSEAVKKVYDGTNQMGVDMVFETAGTPITTQSTYLYAKKGGTIVLVGMCDKLISYNFFDFICKELTLKSVFRYRNLYPAAIEAVASGRVNLNQIVTNTYNFEELFDGLNEVLDKRDKVIKAVIEME